MPSPEPPGPYLGRRCTRDEIGFAEPEVARIARRWIDVVACGAAAML